MANGAVSVTVTVPKPSGRETHVINCPFPECCRLVQIASDHRVSTTCEHAPYLRPAEFGYLEVTFTRT